MINCVQKLKEAGFKLTPQRLAIAKYLDGNTCHPTAAHIYDDLKKDYPGMSMATVYNTLNTMSGLGLVNEHKLFKDQVHYDPDTSFHHHFCCDRCKTVVDVFDIESLPCFKEFEQKTKHRVSHVAIVLKGVCKTCLQNKKQ